MVNRGRFQGVGQIVRFNWTAYAAAGAVVVGATIFAALSPRLRIPFMTGGAVAAFWTVASLAASHWIYDRSKLRGWDWVAMEMRGPMRRAAVLHAGLDESSKTLMELWPAAQIDVWDIYAAGAMTEPSIDRARQRFGGQSSSFSVDFSALPAESGSLDGVFLIFAAHEMRRPKARELFFQELHRTLRPGGEALLVEHLRDAWNFVAFGPGFLHFLPRREWTRLARSVGWSLESEFSITPFVRVFRWRNSA